MVPTLRSFTRPIIEAFTDAGIKDQLDEYELFADSYTPPPTRRGHHARPARPAKEGRQAAMRDYTNRALPENCAPRFVAGVWMVMSNETWEERGRKERRAARLRAERRRGLGRERKKRAFLGGKKGKVVQGGRRRHGAGAMAADRNGVMRKAGGRFKAKGA